MSPFLPVRLRPRRFIRLETGPQNRNIGQMTQRPWTEQEVELLGTKPDDVLAVELNRTLWSVRVKRVKAGILLRVPAEDVRPWLPEEDRLLGTCPDDEAATRLGRTQDAITTRRWMLGIPGFKRRPWTQSEDEVLG